MPTPGYRLADVLLGGNFAERLNAWRSEGQSYEWIARELHRLTDGQVDVTFSTVRNWLVEVAPKQTEATP